MNTKTYPCTRCCGKGRLPFNVLAGVCFKCGGTGLQSAKPAKRMPKFSVSAISKETGSRALTFYVSAPNEQKALQKAKVTLAGGNGYLPETAEVRAA
jgi:hypothetical protein